MVHAKVLRRGSIGASPDDPPAEIAAISINNQHSRRDRLTTGIVKLKATTGSHPCLVEPECSDLLGGSQLQTHERSPESNSPTG